MATGGELQKLGPLGPLGTLGEGLMGGGGATTYEELKRRRAIAQALAARGTKVHDLPSGMTAFGEGVGDLIGQMRLAQLEKEQKARDARSLGGAWNSPRYTPPATATEPATPPPAWKADQTVQQPPGGWTPPPAPAPAPSVPPAATGAPVADAGGDAGFDFSLAGMPQLAGEVPTPDTPEPPQPGNLTPAEQAPPAPSGNLPETPPPASGNLPAPPPVDAQPPAPAPDAQPAAAPPALPPGLPGTNPQDMLIQAVRARQGDIAATPTAPPPGATPAAASSSNVRLDNLHPAARGYAEKVMSEFPGVTITSGYRDPQHNADVGGARGSQHQHARALDLNLSGKSQEEQAAIIDHAIANGARGIGSYGGGKFHVDFRTGPGAAWGRNYSHTSLGGTEKWFQERAAQVRGGGGPPSTAVASAAPGSAAGAIPRPTVTPLSPEGVPQKPAADDAWARYSPALAKMESSEYKDPYTAVGIPTKGGRALGKYQIMSSNVGEWTQAALGKALTPAQFLADPQAQEATAKHRFMQYAAKYGPEGAARAWYAGEGGMNNLAKADAHGRINVGQYGQQFAQHAGAAAPAPQGPTFAAGSEPKDLRNTITATMMQNGTPPPQAPPPGQVASAPAQPQESRGRIAGVMAGLPSRPGGGPPTAALGGGPVGVPTPGQTVSPIDIPPEDPQSGQPRPQTGPAPQLGPQYAQAGGAPAPSWFNPQVGPAPNVAGPPAAAPSPNSGIQKAPTDDAIPGQTTPDFTPKLKLGPEPTPDGPSKDEIRATNESRNPLLSDSAKAVWAERAKEAKEQRELGNARRYEDWKHQRGRVDAEAKAIDERKFNEPKRYIDELNARHQILTQRAALAKTPLEMDKIKQEIDKNEQELKKIKQEVSSGKSGAPATITQGGKTYIWDQGKQDYVQFEPKARGDDPDPRPEVTMSVEEGKVYNNHARAALALRQYNRFPDADKILSEGLEQEVLGQTPFLGNKLMSDKYRVIYNIANNYLQGTQRVVSGAVIGPQEMRDAFRDVIPRAGDDPVTMANKREQRENILNATAVATGQGRKLIEYETRKRDEAEAKQQSAISNEMKTLFEQRGRPPEPGEVFASPGQKTRVWTGSHWLEY